MKLPPFIVVLVLLWATPASATSILITTGLGASAPSGQVTTTVSTGSYVGGAFDTVRTVVDSSGALPGSTVSLTNPFWAKSFLWEWSATGTGTGLDVSALDGLSMYRGSPDGTRLFVRLYTTPLDWFLLDTDTKRRDAIGDCTNRCLSSEGIYTYDRFTVIGNPDWAQITMMQFQIYPASHESWVGKIAFVELPVPVPDGGYTGGFLLTGLVALIIIRERRSQHVR